MLKRILILLLCAHIVYCASIDKSLYEQYISLPQREISCSDLRKQFAEGYIQIKEFIDRIRTCKEDGGSKEKNDKTASSGAKKSQLYSPQYTYTDYLLPVLKTEPRTVQPTNNNQKPNQIYKNMQVVPNLPKQEYKYLSTNTLNFNNQGAVIKKSVNDTNPTVNIVPNVNIGFPNNVQGFQTVNSGVQNLKPEYQNPIPNYLKTIPPVPQTPVFTPSYMNNGVQYSSVVSKPSPYIYAPSNGQQNVYRPSYQQQTVTNNNRQSVQNLPTSESSYAPSLKTNIAYPATTNPESWSDYFQYKSMLNNLGYNQLSIPKSSFPNVKVNVPNSVNVNTWNARNYIYSINPNAANGKQQIRNSIPTFTTNTGQYSTVYNGQVNNIIRHDIPKVSSPVAEMKSELKAIDLELKDDVSLLNENSGGKHPLTLKDYESLAPQIIESIASRSKINLLNKINAKSAALKNSTFIGATKYSNISTNSVKDILDIKYSQLEDKLLNDIRRRQAVLQKLEQESMVEHFKMKPTPVSVTNLGEVFKSMSEEQIAQNIFQNETETSNLLAEDYPQDNMGFFQDSKLPTKKRSILMDDVKSSYDIKSNTPNAQDSSKVSAELLPISQNPQQVRKNTDPRDVRSYMPTPGLGDFYSNGNNLVSAGTNPVNTDPDLKSYSNGNNLVSAGTNPVNTDPDLKGYVNIGPISSNGLLNIENVEGSKNELSTNQLKSYLNPMPYLSRQTFPSQQSQIGNPAVSLNSGYEMFNNAVPTQEANNFYRTRKYDIPSYSNSIIESIKRNRLSNVYNNGLPQLTLRNNILQNSNFQKGYLNLLSKFQERKQYMDNSESKKNNIETLQSISINDNLQNNANVINNNLPTTPRVFSRSILFTDKFYNNLVRAAMKKRIRSIRDSESFNTVDKKSTIFKESSKTRKKRWFKIEDLDYGLNNGNSIE